MMKINKEPAGYRIFYITNIIFLSLLALLCLLPMVNILTMSFSSHVAISRGEVSFWPVGFNTIAYQYLLRNASFWTSMTVSLKRIVLGGAVNMLMSVMIAYPLSKDPKNLPGRTAYAWYFFFTMLFGGGLIPTFLVVKYTGLMDTIWALIIPGAVPIFNIILLLNFFRQLPRELEEAAFVDGAGHWKTMMKIYLPISLPGLATIALFTIVGHWNEWFSAIIYMKHTENYPLQTYLQMVLVSTTFRVDSPADLEILNKLSNKTVSSAQIFIGMIPILIIYPFAQKYFTKGIVLGSVKG